MENLGISSDPPRSGTGFKKYKCRVLTAAPVGFVAVSLTRIRSTTSKSIDTEGRYLTSLTSVFQAEQSTSNHEL
jgi:hypothetical protein